MRRNRSQANLVQEDAKNQDDDDMHGSVCLLLNDRREERNHRKQRLFTCLTVLAACFVGWTVLDNVRATLPLTTTTYATGSSSSAPGSSSGRRTKQQRPPNRPFNPDALRTFLQNPTETSWEQHVPTVFPPPTWRSTIDIYNERAWEDLLQLVHNDEGGNSSSWSMVPNGGSSTAGAGGVAEHERFANRFSSYLQQWTTGLLDPTSKAAANVTIVQRGHGTRHSLHSALFMDFYIPPHADVVLWEFAINDYWYNLDNETGVLEARNSFIYWLDAMAARKPKPPLVILTYLWKTHYTIINGKVDNPVFTAHGRLAVDYPFVVGHANLASYIDEVQLEHNVDLNHSLLADFHHPNPLGHAVLGYLLLDMVTDTSRVPINIMDDDDKKRTNCEEDEMVMVVVQNNTGRKPQQDDPTAATTTTNSTTTGPPRSSSYSSFQWACGNDTDDKLFLMKRIVPSVGHSPRPIAAFTNELPKNDPSSSVVTPGMLSVTPDYDGETVTLGKVDPIRQDRQESYPVPCCNHARRRTGDDEHHRRNNNSSTIIRRSTLDLVHAYGTPLRNIQAIMVGAVPAGNLRVYFDDDLDVPAPGHWINVGEWPCLWSFQDIYPNLHWFALDRERNETTHIHLCSIDDCCSVDSGSSSCTQLLSLVVM
jgi:hypothetical protein